MSTISKIIFLILLSTPALATPSFVAHPSIGFNLQTDPYEYSGEVLLSGGISGGIGVFGEGSDSFYDRLTLEYTNTSGEDQTYYMRWGFYIDGTADANPLIGEQLIYGWDIRFWNLIPEEYGYILGEFQDHVCSPTEQTYDHSCGAYYDGNEGTESLFFAAGETKVFDMVMDFYASASVASVPEAPSLPVVAAGFLCLVWLQRLRR